MHLMEKRIFESATEGSIGLAREGVFEAPFDRFSWRIDDGGTYLNDLKKIDCSIFWKSSGKDKKLAVSTYIKQER